MISSFTDIKAWCMSKDLAVKIYKITDDYPKSELFGLTSQMRRSAVSVPSNIAEGFGRFSNKDQEHFYIMASGSMYELKNQIIISYELGFIDEQRYRDIIEDLHLSHKTLNAFIKAHKKRYNNG
jgi:four helix bundle protein